MYLDNPMSVAYEAAKATHYGEHPLGNSILGTVESITAMTAEQMREYFARRYSPANIVLAFAGSGRWEPLVELADAHCGSLAGRAGDSSGGPGPRVAARSARSSAPRTSSRRSSASATARRWRAPTDTPPTCWPPSSATTPARGSTGR